MPELSSPTTRVHTYYLAAIAEYRAEGGYPDFDNLRIEVPNAFALYVEQLRADPRAYCRPTLLWWIDADEYLGRTSIWHRLSGNLVDTGHVGYDVRPSARRLGHATAMLAASLPRHTAPGYRSSPGDHPLGQRCEPEGDRGERRTPRRGAQRQPPLPPSHSRLLKGAVQ